MIKGLFVLARNGPDRGQICPDRIGPVQSQARSIMAVRLDTARNANRSIRAFFPPSLAWNGDGPSYVWNLSW